MQLPSARVESARATLGRRAAAMAAVGALVVSATACSGSAAGSGADPQSADATPQSDSTRLLPNLRSLPASDLQIEVRDDGVRLLRFAGTLANFGPGPLLLEPRDGENCPGDQRAADQLVHDDADSNGLFDRAVDLVTVRRAIDACMLNHPTHDHWHFDAMAAYTLREPGVTEAVVSRDKVSFCLRDNEQVDGAPVVVEKEHFGECSRDGVQGISPGWVDIYKADLDGQTLELPETLPAGPLCLAVEADPFGLVEETDENDNAAVIALRVNGDNVRQVSSTACA